MTPSLANFRCLQGLEQTAYTPTFPSRRYRYRHDVVMYREWHLEGMVQTRIRSRQTEVTTIFRGKCVMGYQPRWLFHENLAENAEFRRFVAEETK